MIEQDMQSALEGFRVNAAGELSEAESIIATRPKPTGAEILAKAEARAILQTLTAPVDGIINAINVTTIGEIAQPGEPVITLVPAGAALYVEAWLLNKDVGFVAPKTGLAARTSASSWKPCLVGATAISTALSNRSPPTPSSTRRAAWSIRRASASSPTTSTSTAKPPSSPPAWSPPSKSRPAAAA
jgi:hypothetical protein